MMAVTKLTGDSAKKSPYLFIHPLFKLIYFLYNTEWLIHSDKHLTF